jgi:hypothetical protein
MGFGHLKSIFSCGFLPLQAVQKEKMTFIRQPLCDLDPIRFEL